MERTVLSGIFVLAVSTTLAQAEPVATTPANLCQELLVFMQASAPKGAEATPATAKTEQPPAKDGVAADKAQASAAASDPSAKPQHTESTSSQALTGQSGPATDAPKENPAPVKDATAQNAPQRSSVSAPVTNSPVSTPKGSVLTAVKAQALADAGDIAACQAAARELRIAGVTMPAPLLALTALDLQYHPVVTEPQAPDAGNLPSAPMRAD